MWRHFSYGYLMSSIFEIPRISIHLNLFFIHMENGTNIIEIGWTQRAGILANPLITRTKFLPSLDVISEFVGLPNLLNFCTFHRRIHSFVCTYYRNFPCHSDWGLQSWKEHNLRNIMYIRVCSGIFSSRKPWMFLQRHSKCTLEPVL